MGVLMWNSTSLVTTTKVVTRLVTATTFRFYNGVRVWNSQNPQQATDHNLVTIVILGNLHAFFEVIKRNDSTLSLARTHVTLEFDVYTLILPLPSQNKITASNARSHAFLEHVHTLIGHLDRLPNQAIELQFGRRWG